jgi:multisubunit Na+/H+ antiporter MnhG subunit
MSFRDVVVALLLGGAVAASLLSAAGVALMRTAFDRLHFVAPATLAAILIAAAIWVQEPASLISLKALTAAAIVLVSSPLLTHAIARALWIRDHGDPPTAGRGGIEGIEIEDR